MPEITEELEPLFDYRRVQPRDIVILDDDGPDKSPVSYPKRRKTVKNLKSVGKVDDEDDDELQIIEGKKVEEDDWLPPPPISHDFENRLGEDSTIKELRLKKQELETLAKSGVDVLRAVEESVIREYSSSLLVNDASETVAEKSAKPQCERAKIIISIQDKEGTKQFRVYKDDKFERLFKLYADKVKLNIQKLVFSFDGDKVNPIATPDSLDMEDNDIIEVDVKKS
ncbi:uncharacterized protein LOC126675378 [Mercurialis annua]|uniref:uncharacterized protein LOC126675378 n=1 Tax=Mercurialis annua TaxID=3986 RepID=UPI00215EA3C5|nr:uncharacterized protein LOC126675378 [Mercurialis annua]